MGNLTAWPDGVFRLHRGLAFRHSRASPRAKTSGSGRKGCPVMLYNGLLGPIVATHHSVHTSVEKTRKAMNDFFDVAKDQGGNLVLKSATYQQAALAEEMREGDQRHLRGVSPYAGLLILQARLAEVESICLTASIPTAKVKGDRSQPTAIKRMGRVDRLPFGWRLDPHDNKKTAARPGRAGNDPPGPILGRGGPKSPGNLPAAGPGGAGDGANLGPVPTPDSGNPGPGGPRPSFPRNGG